MPSYEGIIEFTKKLQSNWKTATLFIRFNQSLVVLSIVGLLALCSTVFFGLSHPAFLLSENQILYFFSTTSQVIAGLFGLTVAGYVFLRNELDRESKEDDSIADAVNALKNKYFALIAFLSFVGIVAILYSLLAIASENGTIRRDTVTTIINIAGSLSSLEIVSIIYFAFEMLRPNRIETVSTRIKKSFSSEDPNSGSLEEFLRDFNRLGEVLQSFYSNNPRVTVSSASRSSSVSSAKLVSELFFSERIDMGTRDRFLELIKFRNSLVHGKDLSISKRENEWVRELLEIAEEKTKT